MTDKINQSQSTNTQKAGQKEAQIQTQGIEIHQENAGEDLREVKNVESPKEVHAYGHTQQSLNISTGSDNFAKIAHPPHQQQMPQSHMAPPPSQPMNYAYGQPQPPVHPYYQNYTNQYNQQGQSYNHPGSHIAQAMPHLANSEALDSRKGYMSHENDGHQMTSRLNEARYLEYRRIFSSGQKGRLFVEPSEIPMGMDYGYKAITVRNRPLHGQVAEAKRYGWEYVDPARHPDRISDMSAPYIEIDGLVMMERLAEISHIEHQCQDEEQARQDERMSEYLTEETYLPTSMGRQSMTRYSFGTYEQQQDMGYQQMHDNSHLSQFQHRPDVSSKMFYPSSPYRG